MPPKTNSDWVEFGVKALATVALALAVLTLSRHFVASGLFLGYCFLAALPLYLRWKPDWAMLSGLPLIAFLLAISRPRPSLDFQLAPIFLGFATSLLMSATLIWSRSDRPRRARDLAVAIVFPVAGLAAMVCLAMTSGLAPNTYDRYLYAFDGMIGFEPSTITRQIFTRSAALRVVCTIAYGAVPLAICIVYAFGKSARRVLIASLAAALLGTICCQTVPAVGPGRISEQQLSAPSLALISVPVSVPRDCMPSVHLTWALLVYWFSRRSALWLRLSSLLFVVLTGLATLGLGEHYFIDLVVAVPFSLTIWSAVEAVSRPQLGVTCIAVGTTTAWLLLLRHRFVGSPAMNLGLMIFTVSMCFALKSALDQQLGNCP